MRTETPWGPWEPATPAEVAALFAQLRVPWWIAGGYAVEMAVGHAFREHADIDVSLLRRDQLAAQEALPSWEWWAADPPGTLRRWLPGEVLPSDVHDIWCRPGEGEPWRLQIMLEEAEEPGESGEYEGVVWVSHRDRRVRRPIAEIGLAGPDGIPRLAPEIQLLYKAKSPRPKDERDFDALLSVLSPAQRAWLERAVETTYGPHPWAARLKG
ncbi:nucleotidyltransferase domain-containing protein [Streptomyces sp. NPDC056486]|uniref:nucleotidyltransferase domain-containing protein n=1 Tax=Streptomyces sp. NPDC056486 TaxID=3345835 RepID=UPI00369E1B47